VDPGSIVLLLVSFGLLALLATRSRRQQKQIERTQSELEPGRDVMTGSGLHGRVVSVEGSTVELEIAPGVVTRWDRRAVVQIQPAEESEVVKSDTEGAETAPDHPASVSTADPDVDQT
jgi:preprotein translocase subunit YajC